MNEDVQKPEKKIQKTEWKQIDQSIGNNIKLICEMRVKLIAKEK